METLKFILILSGVVTPILLLWYWTDRFEEKYLTGETWLERHRRNWER